MTSSTPSNGPTKGHVGIVRDDPLTTPQEDLTAAVERDEALLPAAPWELWTSNSFRRITGPDGKEGGVLHAYNQRSDGHPDLSMPEEQLFALVRIRNALPALLTSHAELQARAETAEGESAALTKALTGLTRGGSEYFIRKGDRYVADIEACVAYVRQVRESNHETIKRAIAAEKGAEARATTAETDLAQAREALETKDAEIAALKQDVVAFCAPWAVTYARDHGLPANHLHPTHFDILERCGARMVDFTRAAQNTEADHG